MGSGDTCNASSFPGVFDVLVVFSASIFWWILKWHEDQKGADSLSGELLLNILRTYTEVTM